MREARWRRGSWLVLALLILGIPIATLACYYALRRIARPFAPSRAGFPDSLTRIHTANSSHLSIGPIRASSLPALARPGHFLPVFSVRPTGTASQSSCVCTISLVLLFLCPSSFGHRFA